jgi:sensor domain CHASE-containing protein
MNIVFQILPLVIVLIMFAVYLWSGAWAYNDAMRRGKPPMLVALLVLFVAWPISLLVWIALRPEDPRPPFNLDDYRVQ